MNNIKRKRDQDPFPETWRQNSQDFDGMTTGLVGWLMGEAVPLRRERLGFGDYVTP